MITFYQHIQEIIKAYKIEDAEQIASVKRWYNQGAAKVKKKLMRRVNAETIFTDLVDQQQNYQLPQYAGRVFNVRYNKVGNEAPLIEVSNHDAWLELNSNNSQYGVPTHYHQPNKDEIALWPIPHEDVDAGLEVAFGEKHQRLEADDISTGTATVTEGSEVVTLSSSIVEPNFVGRYFCIDDGHEEYYEIVEYVSSTSFKIEQYYDGENAGAGQSYIVGDLVDIPEEYIDLPNLYATSKYVNTYRKNRVIASDMMREFNDELKQIKQDYATPGKSRVVKNRRTRQRAYPYGTPWYFEDQLS